MIWNSISMMWRIHMPIKKNKIKFSLITIRLQKRKSRFLALVSNSRKSSLDLIWGWGIERKITILPIMMTAICLQEHHKRILEYKKRISQLIIHMHPLKYKRMSLQITLMHPKMLRNPKKKMLIIHMHQPMPKNKSLSKKLTLITHTLKTKTPKLPDVGKAL